LIQNTLLTRSCLLFNATRPPPAIVRPLPVKFELLLLNESSQESLPVFVPLLWSQSTPSWLQSTLGHKVS